MARRQQGGENWQLHVLGVRMLLPTECSFRIQAVTECGKRASVSHRRRHRTPTRSESGMNQAPPFQLSHLTSDPLISK